MRKSGLVVAPSGFQVSASANLYVPSGSAAIAVENYSNGWPIVLASSQSYVLVSMPYLTAARPKLGFIHGARTGTPETVLVSMGAAQLQLGETHADTPTAQRIQAHGVTTGTGASLTLGGGSGDTKGDVILDGGNRAALVADATNEATAITLVNALKAAAISHGLMAAS